MGRRPWETPQGYDNRMRNPWNCKDLRDHSSHHSALMHKTQGLSDVGLGIIQFSALLCTAYPSPHHLQHLWCFLFLRTCPPPSLSNVLATFKPHIYRRTRSYWLFHGGMPPIHVITSNVISFSKWGSWVKKKCLAQFSNDNNTQRKKTF